MPELLVTRDGLSIDGKPFYLLSGCIHYFRYPRAEWRDLLLTAKAAGLNTIDTVIPWNRHEPVEGQFDFAGEADLAAYLDLCAELGLYAIVRPGPYICAEWENGGLPAWLTGCPGIALRVDDPLYLEATLRWFDTLLPLLAARQISRGGPLILCQIENEHWASGRYGHDQHQLTLARAAVERGIEVPQYTCMGALRPWPEFRNGWSGIAEKLQQTRAAWPDNPLIVSELWSGWFDNWGSSRHTQKSAARFDQLLHQLTAVGCSGISHWMWAGGTSFGYWGGRTVGGDNIFQTTSYDYDAPVGEYGELREKFFVARRHHLFLATLGADLSAVLADALPGGPRVIAPPAVKGRSEGGALPYRNVRAAPGAAPAWRDFTATFLQNNSLEGQVHQLFLNQPRHHLAVEVEAGAIRPIFTNLPLITVGDSALIRLDYHSGRILGFWPGEAEDGAHTLVIYGCPGEAGELQLTTTTGSWHLPSTPPDIVAEPAEQSLRLRYWLHAEPITLEAHTGERILRILLMTQEHAGRWRLDLSGGRTDFPPLPGHPRVRPPDRSGMVLTPTVYTVAELSDDEGWQPIEEPQALERLGCNYGYGWYRAEFTLATACETSIVAPWLADRGQLFIDGVSLGIFGVHPGEAPCLALPVRLEAGRHELRLLVDNLGRFNYGSNLGELKGLLAPLYLGGTQYNLSQGWCAFWQEAVFAGEALAHIHPAAVRPDAEDIDLGCFAFEGPSVWLVREFAASDRQRYLLQLSGDRNPGALFVNGVEVERFSRHRSGGLIKRDITAMVRPGANVIALNITGYAGMAWRATLLEYDPASMLPAQWSFRAGVKPGAAPSTSTNGGPRFYRAAFRREALAIQLNVAPEQLSLLKLRPGGLCKGQLWLNGRNLGRYWQIGPQEEYKLPVSWLADENELLIFEEQPPTFAAIALALHNTL